MSERRGAVQALVAQGLPERAACRLVGLDRTSFRYHAQPEDDATLRERIRILAQRHPRFGYRRITALLQREGQTINHKRVWGIWQAEKLAVPRRRRPKRRHGGGTCVPLRALHRGHVWTYDFVFDVTERGRTLKMLTVLDEFTRECHAIRVGYHLGHAAVQDLLHALFVTHGPPGYLRSDNGGEFIANELTAWLTQTGTATLHITPGHPWENGYAESFNGKFRDECLNEEVFWNAQHAQVIIERFRCFHNEERPHSALAYQTPAEFAQRTQSHGTILLKEENNGSASHCRW